LIISIVSTFINRAHLHAFLLDNDLTLKDPRIRLYFSVPSKDCLLDISIPESAKYIVKKDESYSEGWNNALSILDFPEIDYVVFLGNGDKFLSIPEVQIYSDTIKVGEVSLISKAKNKVVVNKLPVKSMLWLTCRAWTPAILYPVMMFERYRFPQHYKIAADVDLVFYAFEKGLLFEKITGMSVSMEAGGLSSIVDKSIVEYADIAVVRGVPKIAAKAGLFLKVIKLKLSQFTGQKDD